MADSEASMREKGEMEKKKWKSEKERGEGEERRGEEEEKVGGMRLVKLSYFNKTCRAKREDNEKI